VEQQILREHIRFGFISEYDNSSVGEEERFAARHVWAAFRDWQVR
jgi:hypothetical protein